MQGINTECLVKITYFKTSSVIKVYKAWLISLFYLSLRNVEAVCEGCLLCIMLYATNNLWGAPLYVALDFDVILVIPQYNIYEFLPSDVTLRSCV